MRFEKVVGDDQGLHRLPRIANSTTFLVR
jgi:hypothetical protein